MVRSISDAALAKLAQADGAEPVIIIEVTWTLGGTPIRYATKDMSAPSTDGGFVQVVGKIQEVGAVDSVVALSQNETSEQFDLVLDDTDNTIKSIIDVNDVMLRDVTMYQWFEGLRWEDRFLIFQGKINSPISWSETDRTVKFVVVSQLEDKSVGFSPDEGTFPDLPDDMVGKLWPECFGTSAYQEAIQVDFKHSGTLGDPVGIADFTLPFTIAAQTIIRNYLNTLGFLYAFAAGFAGFLGLDQAEDSLEEKSAGFFLQAAQRTQEILDLGQTLNEQLATEVSKFRVVGGENFPRGTLRLIIDDAIFTGSFSGAQFEAGSDTFNISCQDHPEQKNYSQGTTPCGNPGCDFNACKQLPFAQGIVVTQANGDSFFVPSGNILGEQAGPFFAQGGAGVSIFSAEPLRYFTSITPGKVLKVSAFATFDSGERVLVDVPNNLYRTYKQNYGGVTVQVVEVKDALSKQTPPWEDTIYVTFESSVGPNTIDILTYLIDKYADLPVDTDSFNQCRDDVDNYPMHFCLTQKKNIVTVINELAFMARMAVYIKNGKFFCKYLPAEPNSEFEFDENNVLTQTIQLEFTGTEDLVTEYIGKWRQHGAQSGDNSVNIRYNVKKYGIHQETVDFYAYNYIAAIVKSLTFWINRKGHTWKRLSFQAALDAMNIETFDGVTLNFAGNYASDTPTLGTVENGSYNPVDNMMDFNVWTGVRAGDMDQFDLSYPQDVDVSLTFPDPVAEAAGFGGGDGPGNTSSGTIERVGRRGGVNVTFENRDPYQDGSRLTRDLGSKKPSDRGDTNPGNPTTNPAGQVNTGAIPPPTPGINSGTIDTPGEVFWIDIRTTDVADSNNPGQTAKLDTFFREITDNVLKADTEAIWKNAEGEEAAFDFKFDDAGGKFGAGTAFLQDD